MESESKRARRILAITGAAQGIGAGIALHFARQGYAISFCDPDEQAARKTIAELGKIGAHVVYVSADISKARDVDRWMETTVSDLGCPDVLVNNAGIEHRAPFLELPVEEFDRVTGVNLRGTFLCSQAAARRMASRGPGGAIVNIASTRAFMSEPNTEAYTASKGGIVALTHAMAISLSEHRIRVNCISPGWIETPRVPATGERDRLQHPVGRVGTPGDIAQACLFLAEDAGFMTGQNIIIDGGMSVKMIYEG
jgi:NAD(P)-dependent dehydrogenase (short-subunit alcohol dehydrogenase family)